MAQTIDDLALEFAVLISSSDETTPGGCDLFCLRLKALEFSVLQLRRDICHKYGTDSRQQFQTKRLLEGILTIKEFATFHAEKVNDRFAYE